MTKGMNHTVVSATKTHQRPYKPGSMGPETNIPSSKFEHDIQYKDWYQ